MKILRHILFAAAILVGFSTMALAQKEGDKNNPPPKKDPPVVVVKDKDKDKPKDEKPKDNKKKPQALILFSREESDLGLS